MKVYRITTFTGNEEGADDVYTGSYAEAIKEARQSLEVDDEALMHEHNDDGGNAALRGDWATIELQEIVTEGRGWLLAILNGKGYVRSSRLVATVFRPDGSRRIRIFTPAEWRKNRQAWLTRLRYGDEQRDRVKVTIDPEEPECVSREGHDWQSPIEIVGGIESPGVRGNAGGVIVQEVCMRCGCGRTTDTYAQDPSTGERGLESVSYEPGKYDVEEKEETEDA